MDVNTKKRIINAAGWLGGAIFVVCALIMEGPQSFVGGLMIDFVAGALGYLVFAGLARLILHSVK
jgi:hypothetical protein